MQIKGLFVSATSIRQFHVACISHGEPNRASTSLLLELLSAYPGSGFLLRLESHQINAFDATRSL